MVYTIYQKIPSVFYTLDSMDKCECEWKFVEGLATPIRYFIKNNGKEDRHCTWCNKWSVALNTKYQ